MRIIISLVVLGIALAGIIFLVWPSYQEFASLRTQLRAARERLEQGEEALVKLKAVEVEAQEHEEDFAKIAQAVPKDVALPALYDHVQQLGAASGLQLQSVEGEEQQKKPEQELATLVIRAKFAGSYEGFKQFLNAAQRSTRFLNVRSLNIASSASDSGVLTLTFELVAYARP